MRVTCYHAVCVLVVLGERENQGGGGGGEKTECVAFMGVVCQAE